MTWLVYLVEFVNVLVVELVGMNWLKIASVPSMPSIRVVLSLSHLMFLGGQLLNLRLWSTSRIQFFRWAVLLPSQVQKRFRSFVHSTATGRTRPRQLFKPIRQRPYIVA